MNLHTSTLSIKKECQRPLITSFLGCVMATMCMVGVVRNTYVLVVTTVSRKCTSPTYVYIVTSALADLLYLPTIPFVVCRYFMRDGYFGDCRILFSLDLLTMHASIFILTIVSTECYLAVTRPLDSLGRLKDHWRGATCLVWLVAFLLALPTVILVNLCSSHRDGVTKCMCRMGTYEVYLTVLFNTYILAPGIVICCLYTKVLGPTGGPSGLLFTAPRKPADVPKQKVPCMIFSIMLASMARFLPFWLRQLFSISRYKQWDGGGTTIISINLLVTCLAYSNSCLNPFLYMLLSKNYSEYLRSWHRAATSLPTP
ncbi:urotensin-2 receptor-like [Pelecanus crispus]|uniref:urotensin-2 receptor-like n=1 Tax=Pelecanus crispus TaxID=36300 RepID=UPI003F5D3891